MWTSALRMSADLAAFPAAFFKQAPDSLNMWTENGKVWVIFHSSSGFIERCGAKYFKLTL